ncbi:Gfo/Idh/MocA family oxidoreductase [Idiomarina sp. M1R2S28]|uniref:Gfo/Idh/MocA family oxidoreductase n=1 Tax=Idiomarina rhizosphaerae TaxID=2961572 RepID=A0A9X2JU13_9GAMM|nr:Gfo/Idh/MocA family oxidoreductase [Idiomarina rhizosphaerae]MCP1338551.1 Gfo/Idh/MocA family oxidoreductase [Idiomarina rhizosphaerae]
MNKVAVVGLGNISDRHRRNLKQLFPKACLYCMSASGRIPREVISNADQLVSSIEALIEEQVELVIVASPAPFHAAHAIPLIEAGIPVLIEKPVTATLEDAKALQAAITRYQTPVAVGYCLRYLSSVLEMKAILASGKLGQLYHSSVEIGQYLPDWRPNKDYRESVSARAELGGGALLELSHELDYTRWLLGDVTLEHAILRKTQELGLDVEDSVDLMLSTREKAVVHVHLDFLQRTAYRQCRFVGSYGALEWDLMNNEIRFISAQENQVLYSAPQWDKNQMYTAMIMDFVACIHNQPNQCMPVVEAVKNIELIEQIKKGSPIKSVPVDLKG